MPHYPADHCARVALTFKHSVESVRGEMTFFVQDPTDAIFAASSAFCGDFFASALAHLIPKLAPEVLLDGVVFEDIRAIPYVGADYPQAATPGTYLTSTKPVPTSSCIAIKRVTGNLGRSGRGRLYWPIWDQAANLTADTLPNAYLDEIVAALGDFQAAVLAGGYPATIGVVSFQHGGVAVNPGLFQTVIGWAYADNHIDSQRRRLLGRGS